MLIELWSQLNKNIYTSSLVTELQYHVEIEMLSIYFQFDALLNEIREKNCTQVDHFTNCNGHIVMINCDRGRNVIFINEGII